MSIGLFGIQWQVIESVAQHGTAPVYEIERPTGHWPRGRGAPSPVRVPAAEWGVVARIVTGPHDAHRQDPHVPMRHDTGRVLTPLYVKTLVQAAWMISWRARKSVMTRW